MVLQKVEVGALIRPVVCEEARDIIRYVESMAGRVCRDKALAREVWCVERAAVKFVLVLD